MSLMHAIDRVRPNSGRKICLLVKCEEYYHYYDYDYYNHNTKIKRIS